MLDYCITGSNQLDKKGGRIGERNRWYQALLILIFLFLIVGFGFSVYGFYYGWMNGSMCSNKLNFPFTIVGMTLYLYIILWFSKYPFRDTEFIKKFHL
jgi:hypothetical protein